MTDTVIPDLKAAITAAAFATELEDFINEPDEEIAPLLGDDTNTVIPAAGLVIVAGKPGVGKTTLILDLAFHLASGLAWPATTQTHVPQIPIGRPLNILLIENEGPTRLFRRKLRTKRERWPHEREGHIWVQRWRWGSFAFSDRDARNAMLDFLQHNPVDLVIGDPLTTLGVEGVGSPEDTRKFVAHLVELGLLDKLAFLFLHHFRKDPTADEVDQLSGAWAGHLDALMVLKPTRRDDEVRLSFPKLRWAEDDRKPLLLGKVRNTSSFELLGEEGDVRMLEREIIELLSGAGYTPLTTSEIAGKNVGISARRKHVDDILKGNQHLFESINGKAIGRSKQATCWRLAHDARTSPDTTGQAGQAGQVEAPGPRTTSLVPPRSIKSGNRGQVQVGPQPVPTQTDADRFAFNGHDPDFNDTDDVVPPDDDLF